MQGCCRFVLELGGGGSKFTLPPPVSWLTLHLCALQGSEVSAFEETSLPCKAHKCNVSQLTGGGSVNFDPPPPNSKTKRQHPCIYRTFFVPRSVLYHSLNFLTLSMNNPVH